MSNTVSIDLTVRLDPAEPMLGAGPAVYADLANRPVIAVGNLGLVDPCRIGEVVVGLLRAAILDQR